MDAGAPFPQSPRDCYAPVSDDDWPVEIADLLAGFAGGLNVYRAMAHHPALVAAWANLREHVVNQTSLGPELSEVVILRTGARLGASYELQQHIVRARRCGMDDRRIAAISASRFELSPQDAVLAEAVDELVAEHRISPKTELALRAMVGKHGVLDVIATVGFYTTLAYILNTFQTPLDQDVADILTDRPLAP